eukprot:jgi/Mesvir1/12863/Mv26282-RA.1
MVAERLCSGIKLTWRLLLLTPVTVLVEVNAIQHVPRCAHNARLDTPTPVGRWLWHMGISPMPRGGMAQRQLWGTPTRANRPQAQPPTSATTRERDRSQAQARPQAQAHPQVQAPTSATTHKRDKPQMRTRCIRMKDQP